MGGDDRIAGRIRLDSSGHDRIAGRECHVLSKNESGLERRRCDAYDRGSYILVSRAGHWTLKWDLPGCVYVTG